VWICEYLSLGILGSTFSMRKGTRTFSLAWLCMLRFNWASIFIFSFQTVGNVHPCASKLNFRPSFQWVEGQFEFPVPLRL